MKKVFIQTGALILVIILLALPQGITLAQQPTQTHPPQGWLPPPGFEQTLADEGVFLYQKRYANGTPDYVQVVLLDRGAWVELMHAGVAQERPGRGVFGGNDARFNLNNLPNYWYQARKLSQTAFCVSNGSFFYMPETPTRLPFPLKKDGKLLTDGYGQEQYPGQMLMLELWPGYADIRPLTAEDLYQSTAPDILGGLAEDANKRAKFSVGRTFAGVQDFDGDGKMEILYLLNSQTHTQSTAAQVLRDFGAQKVMMLDGGGSTQLLCQGKDMISSERLIPQVVAVFAAETSGAPAAFAAQAESTSAAEVTKAAETQGAAGTLESDQPTSAETLEDADTQPSLAQNAAAEKISLRGLLYVPLIVLPLGLLLYLLFSWLRH